jgi:cycloeucalenol cycloisomerase
MWKMAWKAENKSKAYGETFVLYYSAVWMSFLGAVVVFRWYEMFSPHDYVLVGLGIALPCIIGPLLLPNEDEKKVPVFSRYIIKANIFVFIAGYIGNHFFTHYFYDVLEMKYTGPLAPGKGLEINQVPVSMFLFTHPYFMTYHVLATTALRAAKSYLQRFQFHYMYLLFAIFVMLFAFATAFLETWTISGFPYYTYPDLYTMLTKGSAFYSVFFLVTYPWFYRLDEDPHSPWPISRVITESLAAMMVVLLCADFLRLAIK